MARRCADSPDPVNKGVWMVALIGRHRGIRIRATGLEMLFPADEDLKRPLIDRLCRVLQSSDPIVAGEIAHASGGLALADRLITGERVWLVGSSLLRRSITDELDARSTWLWAPIDFGAIVARILMRLTARDSLKDLDDTPMLFITGPRQVSQVKDVLDVESPRVIDLRREARPQGLKAQVRALRASLKSSRGLALDARLRLARLRFEADPIVSLVEDLVAKDVRNVYFGDVTGHRARICAQLCVEAGIETTIVQHGRIGNPCPYIPPPGVTFVGWSVEDVARLKAVLKEEDRVRWLVAQRKPLPQRAGFGVLVCPSVVGSSERFKELKSSIQAAKSLGSDVAVRFHPSERFQRLKARRLGVERVSASVPLAEVDVRWGRAIVPFMSSVHDDLLRHGFTVLDLPGGLDR